MKAAFDHKNFDLSSDDLKYLVAGAQQFLPPIDPRDGEKLSVVKHRIKKNN